MKVNNKGGKACREYDSRGRLFCFHPNGKRGIDVGGLFQRLNLFEPDMQYDDFGAGSYTICRSGATITARDEMLDASFLVIAERAFINPFHHNRIRP